MILTLTTLALAAIFFVLGKPRADIVALLALLALALGGVISLPEALSGFSNSIVIMMIGLFVVGGAIFNTGLAKILGAKMLALGGKSPMRLFLIVICGTAFIGAFVSNTGTVALMLPIIVSMAASGKASVSRLLMPLAFASSMGGMLTLIGTPPNLVIAEVWQEYSGQPLSFFTFTPAGLICIAAGTLLLIPLSKWFLEKKNEKGDSANNRNKTLAELVAEYDLQTDLYRLSVPNDATICGSTIAQLNLRRRFGIEILEVRPGDAMKNVIKRVKQFAANPDTVISQGDFVYLRGRRNDVENFARTYHLEFEHGEKMEFYDIGLAEIVLMPNSPIIGKTIAAINFRGRFGVNVMAVKRKNEYINTNLGSFVVRPGDLLLVQGQWNAIDAMTQDNNSWVVLGQPLSEASKVTLDYKAPIAAAIMLAMIVMLVVDIVPPVFTVMTAAILTVLCGCFRNVEDAYRKINWESVVLIAAMMPMSFALEKTGISQIVSSTLVDWLGSYGPFPLLAGVYFTTSIMTLFISNTATAVLIAPIAVQAAVGLGVSPLPFLFAVTFGASLCFASPFSTPPNALVMSPGQYVFADYVKVGVPMQIIMGIIMICVLPILFPF